MTPQRIIVVGGGAAGFFAALACAEKQPGAQIFILEKTAHFLAKVKISGGGRCNVTHACFNAREFTTRYPRGERELIAPFQKFSASDAVAWFAANGVPLRTEADGRMFPTSNSSQTVMNCLLGRARAAGVKLMPGCGVERVVRKTSGGFELTLANGDTFACDQLLLALGGCRTPALGQLAVSLGHTLEAPVPSLFTFQVETPWLRELSGVAVELTELSVPGTKLRERGALLATHWGLSGPAVLRLSAWGARMMAEKNYQFPLHVNWLPQWSAEKITREFQARQSNQPARFVVNSPLQPLTTRLWEKLVVASGAARDTRWSAFSSAAQHRLIQQLIRSEFPVTGKSLNKDEFVTCGGVRLREVDFKTMESRICPGLFFAGEVLDIDGITGGFNFQAAWTTGWIAGRAMAERIS